MEPVDEILRRHGMAGPARLLPLQGKATTAWATGDCVIKIARPECRDQVATEVLVAPLARAAGVRTPALVAWAREPERAYSVWERVAAEPIGDANDAASWRQVGRELARLHRIDRCDDPLGVLRKRDKRNARPHLHALRPERAAFFAAWLDRCERAPAASPRLLHYDVHGGNVLRAREGATLIDWADAAWGDPAAELGSLPMCHLTAVLNGYEELGSLGRGAEGRILGAIIGQSVRMIAERGWDEPLQELLAFVSDDPPARFAPWLPPR